MRSTKIDHVLLTPEATMKKRLFKASLLLVLLAGCGTPDYPVATMHDATEALSVTVDSREIDAGTVFGGQDSLLLYAAIRTGTRWH
jgi:hypothetical protein